MTVVNPKSISGITSITTASGSDNLLTIHTSDANNTERFRIDSTGTTKIVTGIVTTLTATGSAKVGTGITLSSDGHSFVAGVSTTGTLSVSGIVTSTGDVDPITGTITSSGDITVGGDLTLESVTPAIKLTDSNQETDNKTFMISGSTTKKLRIQALTDAGGGGGELFEFVRDGNNVRQFQGAKSAVPWFVVNNNTKKVGIGTTIPRGQFDVLKDTGNVIALFEGSNSAQNHRVRIDTSGGSSTSALSISNSNSNNQTSLYHSGGNNNMAIMGGQTAGAEPTAGTAIATFANGGDVTINTGNLVIGTSGKGIDFSATGDASGQTSELLDDYEEGTVTFASTNGGVTFDSDYKGRYTKIGELVTVSGYLVFESVTNSGTALRVQMPFTSAANSEGYYTRGVGAVFYRYLNTPTNQQHLVAYVGGGENYMRFYSSGDSTDWHQTDHNQVSTSTKIYFNICYTTTS